MQNSNLQNETELKPQENKSKLASPTIKTTLFHNIIARGIKRNIEQSIKDNADIQKKNLLQEIDVTIKTEKGQTGHFFLGDLALDGIKPSYIWSSDRVNDFHSRVAIYTALALQLPDNVDQGSFVVMTGLPLLDLEKLKQTYEENLPGKMEIMFNSGPWKGKTKVVEILKAKATAQGYGIYLNQTLNNDGKLCRPELLKGTVGILDTGFKTTNFLHIRNGEPKDIGSLQSDDGMSNVHERIQDFINNNEGYISIEEVDKIYFSNEFECAEGKIINFEFEKSIACSDLSTSISQTAKRLWNIQNTRSIIVGGGGGKGLYDYYDFKQKELDNDSQFANALGYLKGALRQLRKSSYGEHVIPVGIDSGFGYMKVAIFN